MPHPGPWDGWPPGLRLLCVTPAACVSCCPGSGAGCTEGLLCWVTGQADPLGARWLFAGWGHGRSWGSVSPQVGGCGAGVPKRALVRRAVLQTRHTLSQAGSERPPSWAGEPAGAAPRAHPSASSRHPKPEWSLWSSSASCWTSWPSPCCCPCYLRCWSATAVCRILSMARGSAGWTGLLQPLGCQPRRGLIGSVFSLLQFLSAPLTGAVSDCLGRRPVLLLSLAGLATSYAVWATSKSFAAFLVSRIIGGISKGNVSLSTAIVADLGSSPARSRGMAVIGVAFSLAFTLGPMLGASLPVETAPWLALLFAVSDLLFIFCFLPETLPPEKRAPSITLGFRAAVDLLSPLALLCFSAVARGPDPPIGVRLGSLRLLGLVYFLYLFLFSGLEFTLSFLVHQRFQFSSLEQGKMFFFIGLTMATIQGAYARRISPGGEIAAVKRAVLLLVPAFLLIGWGHTLPVLGLGLLLYSFAAAIVVPCLSSVVAGYGSPGQKGVVMGTLRSLGALARALGPTVAASVYWLAGARVCYTVCAGLFLLPFSLLRKLRSPAGTLKAE
ncbi:major facilitator superfamily domain-containing protein 10 isoform X4 [Balaenoptera musculus]|uniref:Major facilitator superfamily domain-containing protein 10 isoform X4 n=1 Tax=Balaenoptera musculus TaxID=9771 RepID=A0A8B8XPP3_BALMU|nr:major facilitator superfamily domain-containing protein 10 isoform X4 [Balaenoptera musculus]